MTSEPLRILREQKASIVEVARLAELRVLAVEAERLARLDEQILRFKYADAKRRAAAEEKVKRIKPRILQALPIESAPQTQPAVPEGSAPKKLQSALPAGKQTTRKQRKPKAGTTEAV